MRNLGCGVVLLALVSSASAADWPQWLGPTGDSIWAEPDLITSIPASGLTVKWEHPVGLGYAGPAVAGGRVYLMDYVRTEGEITNNAGWADELKGRERVICLDAVTGDH